MRKQLQGQLLEILSTIRDGVGYIQKVSLEEKLILLNDCYATLFSIQDALKSGLSDGRVAAYLPALEQGRALLEQINEAVQTGEDSAGLIKEAQGQVGLVREKLQNEPEIVLEIVFMPYKASMWDSLESVWRAAKEDPSCDCYVVPIPYYDKNASGRLTTAHYEGDLFPGDVPITDYREYSLSQRQPDIIYIHNPYNDSNFFTSVHPEYYTEKLKQYTSMLVYIPYYIASNTSPSEDLLQRDSFVFHIDKIILQSESLKKIYTQWIDEEKLVVLGSPKIDKIIYNEKNKPEIPAQWKTRIQDKKVVLYCPSLQWMLENQGICIDKLKAVFESFKRQKNIILLWRPHPLTQTTLQEMAPKLGREYAKLVEQYKKSGIGIYDDSPDPYISMAVADAYYGDVSSLILLFSLTEKPIMMQSNHSAALPTGESTVFLNFLWADMSVDNQLYFLLYAFNGLFKADIDTGRCTYLGPIPDTWRYAWLSHSGFYSAGDLLISLPFATSPGKTILFYHTVNRKWEQISLDEQYGFPYDYAAETWQCRELCYTVQFEESLYLIPYRYNAIVQYDLHTKNMKYHTDWVSLIPRDNPSFPIFGISYCITGEILSLPLFQSGAILNFHLRTGESRIVRVDPNSTGYGFLYADGTYYWFLEREGALLVRWHPATREIQKYADFPDNCKTSENEYAFAGIVQPDENTLLLIPGWSNMIVKVDKKTGEMQPFTEIPIQKDEYTWMFMNKFRDWIVVTSPNEQVVYFYNYKNKQLKKHPFQVPLEEYKSYFDQAPDIPVVFPDLNLYMLGEHFFSTDVGTTWDMILHAKHAKIPGQASYVQRTICNTDGTCGQKIHDYILQQIQPPKT